MVQDRVRVTVKCEEELVYILSHDAE